MEIVESVSNEFSHGKAAGMSDYRRNQIKQYIEKEGFVSLRQLAGLTAASESTLRRDLEYLEEIGQIRRTRGGATYVGDSITTLDERFTRNLPQKQIVGQAAAELIEAGEAVMLDGGSTTLELARHLQGKSIQVVTNSLPVVNLLANQTQIEVLMLGGYVYPKSGVALGPVTIKALEEIHVRRLFISVGGITERGLFNSNSLLVDTERAMLAAAEEIIVVTDSSKLGHSALAHLCPLARVQRVVVDAGISEDWKATLEREGVAVTIAGPPPAPGQT